MAGGSNRNDADDNALLTQIEQNIVLPCILWADNAVVYSPLISYSIAILLICIYFRIASLAQNGSKNTGAHDGSECEYEPIKHERRVIESGSDDGHNGKSKDSGWETYTSNCQGKTQSTGKPLAKKANRKRMSTRGQRLRQTMKRRANCKRLTREAVLSVVACI
jgi:hypothetical protein